MPEPVTPNYSPTQALAELMNGNARFVANASLHPNQNAAHRHALAHSQSPFAVIFGCSDSRLSAEIIFDRGLGDLFVVRTAGPIIGEEVLGSIEYAVTILQTPLVVVLGHNSCGAIKATQDALASNSMPDGHLRAVVEAVAPSLQLASAGNVDDVDGIVDIHVERTAAELLGRSGALTAAVDDGRCAVAGMSYHLSAGRIRLVTSTL